MYDTSLNDFPRLSGETDDAPRIQRAVDATENGILWIPKGEYAIAETVRVTNRCSLEMHPAAHLVAVKKMDYVLDIHSVGDYHALTLFNEDGNMYDNLGLFVHGGDLDGAGLASCMHIVNAHHYTMRDTVFHNGFPYGLCVGNCADGHLYELIATNLYCKCNMPGLAGNIGIYSTLCDSHYTDCVVVDYTVGICLKNGANRLTRCHVWGGTVPPKGMTVREWSEEYGERKRKNLRGEYGEAEKQRAATFGLPEMLPNSISFDIQSGSNVLDGCFADTAEIGYRIAGNTILTNSSFFNNPLMGRLEKSTVIHHVKGTLDVTNCDFRRALGIEKIYEGCGDVRGLAL